MELTGLASAIVILGILYLTCIHNLSGEFAGMIISIAILFWLLEGTLWK